MERRVNAFGFEIRKSHRSSAAKWTALSLTTAAVTGAVFSTGVAYAFWSASGTGSGSATSGSATAVAVAVTNVPGLYPLQKTTVPVRVTNPNASFAVKVNSITLSSVIAPSGCAAGDITLDSTQTGGSATVFTPTSNTTLAKAGTGDTQSYSVPIAVGDLADTCQGKTFTLNFSVSSNT